MTTRPSCKVYKSPLERAQALLNEMAKVSLTGKDGNTKNGQKRRALQVPGRAAASDPAAAGAERAWPFPETYPVGVERGHVNGHGAPLTARGPRNVNGPLTVGPGTS